MKNEMLVSASTVNSSNNYAPPSEMASPALTDEDSETSGSPHKEPMPHSEVEKPPRLLLSSKSFRSQMAS